MPYRTEHACRLEDPGKFVRFARKTVGEGKDKKTLIIGIPKEGGSRTQAIRYSIDDWTKERAAADCKKNKGRFEAAKPQTEEAGDGIRDLPEITDEELESLDLDPGLRKELFPEDDSDYGTLSEMTDKAREMERRQPAWSNVDKTKLPKEAFAYVGDPDLKSTWKYPYKWQGPNGLEVHIAGLRAAWTAAHGARRRPGVSQSVPAGVIAKLKAQMKKYGIGEAAEEALEDDGLGIEIEALGTESATQNTTKPEPEIVFESATFYERLENGQVIFESGPLYIEDTSGLDPRRPLKGRVPLLTIDAVTANKRRYREGFVKALEKLVEDAKARGDRSLGVMYLTHLPAQHPDKHNPLREKCALITGFERVPGTKRVDMTFETMQTNAGRDAAVLIRTPGQIKGSSLRTAVDAKDTEKTEEGITDVIWCQGCEGDFTDTPAMPGNDVGVQVTEEANEVKTLKELQEKDPEAAKALRDAAAKEAMESDDIKKLREEAEEAKKLKAAQTERDRKDARAKIVEGLTEHAKTNDATKGFSDTTRKALIESLGGSVDRVVAELIESGGYDVTTKGFVEKALGKLEPDFDAKAEEFKAIVAEERKSALKQTAGTLAGYGAVNVNSLPKSVKVVGEDREQVGLPTNDNRNFRIPTIKDKVLSAAYKIPMYESDGSRVFEKYFPNQARVLRELKPLYRGYPFHAVQGQSSPPTDAMFESAAEYESHRKWVNLVEEFLKRDELGQACDLQLLTEANEVTKAIALGTLLPDVRDGILEAVYAKSAWLNIATISTSGSDQYRIYYEEARRLGDHFFGYLAQGGSFSTTESGYEDESALTYGQKAYCKVTTQIAGATTVTITYTDQNGTGSKTATCSLANGETVGTYVEVVPNTIGDRITDISGATASGWSAGAVAFCCEDPTVPSSASETSTSGRARTIVTSTTGTMEEHSLESELTWQLIEDSQKAMATMGAGAWDAAGRIVANMAKEVAEQTDIRGFGALNSSTNTTGAALTFDVTAAGRGASYTDAGWKATLWNKLTQLQARVDDRSDEVPTVLAINVADVEKMGWIDGFVKNPQRAGLPASDFYGALDIGQIAGMKVVVAKAQNHNRMIAVSPNYLFHAVYIPLEIRGPFGFIGGEKTDTYVIRKRVKDVYVRPLTRGYLTITDV